jgi:hypothetical protein
MRRTTTIGTAQDEAAAEAVCELETQTDELTEHTDRLQEIADATSDLVKFGELHDTLLTDIRDALLAHNDLLVQIRDGQRTPPVIVVDENLRVVGLAAIPYAASADLARTVTLPGREFRASAATNPAGDKSR